MLFSLYPSTMIKKAGIMKQIRLYLSPRKDRNVRTGAADVILEVKLQLFRNYDEWDALAVAIRNITESSIEAVQVTDTPDVTESNTLMGRLTCSIGMTVDSLDERLVYLLLENYQFHLQSFINPQSATLHVRWY